jgi:hypothetical protein
MVTTLRRIAKEVTVKENYHLWFTKQMNRNYELTSNILYIKLKN